MLGATGLVGGAVARALRADGVPVLAAGRDQDRLAALAHEGCATTRLGEPALLGQDVARFAATHGVQGVVAAIGGWWIGDRLLDLDPTTWEAMLASHLTAHLDAARTLAPHLPPGAAWVVLNGAASSEPMAHSGPVSVTGAGLHMLVEVLRAEEPPGGTRFHEVVVDHAIAGDDRNLDPAVEVPLDAVVATVLARLPHDAAPGVVHVPARA
ncbi:hypothetical protein CLV28_1602 [Sediminihabitans luteus]|uniref:Short subunit dehydrogenase n=1 Tax=Sediminihabitans luteus TaxID=1138585 RepID=A0A2M9CQA9_9CELL|nr:hypothetical protein CLV28_1602 [Sediminihabitans luteus]GII97971.1 hypothetical protein Slu03_03490 [Sediminihabitans luteus]